MNQDKNGLKSDMSQVLNGAHHVIAQFESGKWKGISDPQIDASYRFCQLIINEYKKVEKDIGIEVPGLLQKT